MARQMKVEFLGRIPMEVETRRATDRGSPVVLSETGSRTVEAFTHIAKKVEDLIS